MIKIVLIRHAKTTPLSDVPPTQWVLSDEGAHDASLLVYDSDVAGLNVIYCSDQPKAQGTANMIAKGLNISTVHIRPGLTEATSITNGWIDKYEAEVGRWHMARTTRINNGETANEAQARFDNELATIASEAASAGHSAIGVVTHANVLGLSTSRMEGGECSDSFAVHGMIQMPDIAVIKPGTPTSIIRWWGKPTA